MQNRVKTKLDDKQVFQIVCHKKLLSLLVDKGRILGQNQLLFVARHR